MSKSILKKSSILARLTDKKDLTSSKKTVEKSQISEAYFVDEKAGCNLITFQHAPSPKPSSGIGLCVPCDMKEEIQKIELKEEKKEVIPQKGPCTIVKNEGNEEESLEASAEKIKLLQAKLSEELRKCLEDFERMAIGNSIDVSVLCKFRSELEETLKSVTNRGNELISKIVEQAIPKVTDIQQKVQKFQNLKQELKREVQDIEAINDKFISDKILSLPSGGPEKLLNDLSRSIQELVKLKQDVYQKILDSQQSFQDRVLKSIEFHNDTAEKIRQNAEKTILNTIQIEEQKAQKVDLCFMLDFTASMQPYIDMVRSKITHVVIQLQKRFSGFQLRISVSGYRDIKDKYRFETINFCTSIEEIQRFLQGIKTSGGRDLAEDINGAFQKCLSLNWESPTKIIMHITDAPCHGRRYHDLTEDEYENGHKFDVPYNRIFAEIKAKQINYVLLKINKSTDKMFKVFKEIYNQTEPVVSSLLFIQDEINNDYETVYKALSTHISSSILHSVREKLSTLQKTYPKIVQEKEIPCLVEADDEDDKEIMKKNNRSPKDPALQLLDRVSTKKEQQSFCEVKAKIYYLFNVEKLRQLTDNHFAFSTDTVELEVCKSPFAAGSFHLAYHCKGKPSISTCQYNMVLKRALKEENKMYYFSVLKKNTIAVKLSEQFNKLLKCYGFSENERIYFTRVIAVKYQKKFYLLEAYINEKFEKYTNNFTYVNESVPLMSAFSHFTYEYTKGKFMVTDLQGWNNLLTDPAVHSFNIEFPRQGDLGLKGMMGFFRYHVCSDYCKRLFLGSHSAQKEKVDEIVYKKVEFNLSKLYRKCKFYYCNRNVLEGNLCEVCKACVNVF